MKIIKLFVPTFLIVSLFLGYVSPVSAQAPTNTPTNTTSTSTPSGAESSIKAYLCTPTDGSGGGTGVNNAAGDDLFRCINKIYRFAIAFSSLAAVFMIVVAGYLYMSSDGNEESVRKAKDILISSITAIIILLITYVLLREINPELVKFKVLQPGIVANTPGLVTTPTSGGGTGSGVSYGGSKCSPVTSGPGSITNLTNSCFGKYGSNVVRQASIVVSNESGGDPSIHVNAGSCGSGKSAQCSDGTYPVWGLFQINLTVHSVNGLNCPSAFTHQWTCSGGCAVKSGMMDLYNQCVAAAKNATNNINTACTIYDRTRWQEWGNVANQYPQQCGGQF